MSNQATAWRASGSHLGFFIDGGAIRVDKDSCRLFQVCGSLLAMDGDSGVPLRKNLYTEQVTTRFWDVDFPIRPWG